MAWQASARQLAQRAGLDPRYLRRLRWIGKAAAVRSVGASVPRNLRYVLSDPEPANYTYELSNEDVLVTWTAEVGGCERDRAQRLISEAREDAELHDRLTRATAGHWWWTKPAPRFGRRLAWYALVRLLAPELVVETGVHDGLGSLLLLRALERNRDERAGPPPKLVSFDINPTAGWLVGQHPLWELRLESSRDGLEAVLARGPQLGLFVHDSLHTYEHERWELETAVAKLAPNGVLISDNAHGTSALSDTCEEHGRRFLRFYERSCDHFYPGGAMGAGYR
jgi:hypothetical protein